MITPGMASSRHGAAGRSLGIVTAVCVLLLTACATGQPTATWVTPSPAPTSTAAPLPESPSSPTPSSSHMSLAEVLAELPHFPAAPKPVPIPLGGGPLAPIFYRLPVTEPVAFLTIDDGLDQLPDDLRVMKAAHIPFTMFLIGRVAAGNPAYFRSLESDGGVIEDHTMTHPDLRGEPYATQRNEICGARSLLADTFGRTPSLFRPPYGDFDNTTLRAVHDCGLEAALHWSETVNNGKVNYQTPQHQIRPGDIILMHFRPAFGDDVLAALLAIARAGLVPALLEDYLPALDG